MVQTEPFDAARCLASSEAQADLLNDALASGDASYVAHALGVIARVRGMANAPREGSTMRGALDSDHNDENGDPRVTTLLDVARALGVTLSAHLKPAA